MADTYKISGKLQFKSIKEGLWNLLVLLFAVLLVFVSGKVDLSDYRIILTLFGSFYVVLFCPVIYLHLEYLAVNSKTTLTVDKNRNEIIVTTASEDYKYKLDDIDKSELNLGFYFREGLGRRSRWTAPWTNYGYFRVRLKDGKEFFFTSLMLDLDKLPFPAMTRRYRFIPYIDHREIKSMDIKTIHEGSKSKKIIEPQDRFDSFSDDN